LNSQKPYELEICIDSLESAIGAQESGADRVELCGRLDLDGLTPELEVIKKCRDLIDIGLHVMVRPNAGEFTVSEEQLALMLTTIDQCKSIGVNGVVFGALDSGKNLDIEILNRLQSSSSELSVTFHRAFDVCQDPLKTFDELGDLKVDRLLTSGQGNTALEGIELIQELNSSTGQYPSIMVGSGVSADNIPEFWNVGIRQYHFTSHVVDANGKLIFDPAKTLAAKSVLESLCDT
jgi:copper homeostasis protein